MERFCALCFSDGPVLQNARADERSRAKPSPTHSRRVDSLDAPRELLEPLFQHPDLFPVPAVLFAEGIDLLQTAVP